METAGLRFTQWGLADVAADEESRDELRKRTAQLGNCLNPGLAIRQAIIRNNQIRRSPLIGKGSKRATARISGYDTATPTAQQSASTVEYKLIVIDEDDKLAFRAITRNRDCSRWIGDFVPAAHLRSRRIDFGKLYQFVEPLPQGGCRCVNLFDDSLLFDLTYKAAQLRDE